MNDFAAAAARHWQDGDHLYAASRYENADQLFGFAAECALKVVLLQHNPAADGSPLSGTYLAHIDVLWNRMPSQAMGKRFPAISALLKQENPFATWSTNHRYGPSGVIGQADADAHRTMARRLLGAAQVLGSRTRN